MRVLKFGGSSVASPDRIQNVKEIVHSFVQKGEQLVVVVSAFSGVTDQLINMAKTAEQSDESYKDVWQELKERHIAAIQELLQGERQTQALEFLDKNLEHLSNLLKGTFLIQEASPRMIDQVSSFGELLSSYIIALYVDQELGGVKFLDSRRMIATDSNFLAAKVDFERTNQQLNDAIESDKSVHLMGGFIASNQDGVTTTLGRGGSDYTAAIVAAGVGAEELEIWTDVDGVMTADPRKVKRAFTLNTMTYEEALEMSHFGAKVIHPPTIQPVLEKNIPIRIRNTFNPEFEGTFIAHDVDDNQTVKGIASISDIVLLNVQGSGMIGVAGIAGRLFSALAKNKVNIILITQASSEHSITFAVKPVDAKNAKQAIEEAFEYELKAGLLDEIELQYDLSIVAVIGSKMKHTTGLSGRLFKALGNNGVNIFAIAQGSSELNISVVVEKSDEAKSISALHQAFFDTDLKTINIYLVGHGLIGKTLLEQMRSQQAYLLERYSLEMRLVGITNTRKMHFESKGMNILEVENFLEQSDMEADLRVFIENMKVYNLSNSILIDCTASKVPTNFYREVLESSISIVTPNKIANSGSYQDYLDYQHLSQKHHAHFLYETNVGAGLPIISTIKDLLKSGDEIHRIEAVLSGSLSFIFNTYSADNSFYEVVQAAKDRGFTEPDPRDDLSGKDVARKALILAREIGVALEMDEIDIENILPSSSIEAPTVDAFMDTLKAEDAFFVAKRDAALAEGKRLRFLASITRESTKVELVAVDAAHPFYDLSGSDNMVVLYSQRYKERPLVIKGPGAGASVTAAGVFAEIIRIGTQLKV